MIGRLPLEFVLLSFLFQLVGTYVDFDGDTLVQAVMKRLQASHNSLQVRAQLHTLHTLHGFCQCFDSKSELCCLVGLPCCVLAVIDVCILMVTMTCKQI